jgi:hypothetical protein
MQLSVPRYAAVHWGRGANLDLVDLPLNNRLWLKERFEEIRQAADEKERLVLIDGVVNWTNPGPGGFYDDLGNAARQPHLLRGPGPLVDPEFRETSLIGFEYFPTGRMSWLRHAEARYDAPLRMRYEGLRRDGDYRVRVVYAGDNFDVGIRLDADGIEVHPFIKKERPLRPVEFDVPREATADGELTLEWRQEPGGGGAGRGCQVAEVWLISKQSAQQYPSGSEGLGRAIRKDLTE